jgi:alkaline phosphatase D
LSSLCVYLFSISQILKGSPVDDSSAGRENPAHANGAVQEPARDNVEQSPRVTTAVRTTSGRKRRFWLTLLCGLPSPKSPLLTALTIETNLLLAGLTLDAVLRPPLAYPCTNLSLTRVGYVSDTTCQILVREPDALQLPLYVHYRSTEPSRPQPWQPADTIYYLSDETDYTSSISLNQLRPATNYEYSLSNNHSGYFTTAPSRRDPAANSLTFVTSSCIKPNFPYNPFRHPLHIPGLTILSDVLQSLSDKAKPVFMLFLGDFIYVDVPFRLGSSPAHYRSEYRRVYSSPSWQSGRFPPFLFQIDDHEIANDWRANTSDPYPAAVDPFHLYHASVNPPRPASAPRNATYFSFDRGPASFFVLDTRTYRSLTRMPPSILGDEQLELLLRFLYQPVPKGIKWKIVVSSVPFTKNWRFGTEDTWGGYLEERQTVLRAMWEVERMYGVGIVVLSGDRHEFGATKFPEPTSESAVHEFSVGPLSMFYLPIRTYRQVDEEDVAIKYLPDGQSKFGIVEIENMPFGGQSVLRYRLFINGKEVWDYVITSPVVSGSKTGLESLWS